MCCRGIQEEGRDRHALQVVNDLRTLRTLGEYLLCFDAVTFLAYLEALRASESVASVWLFHEAAHTIFEQVPPSLLLVFPLPSPRLQKG